MDSFFFCVYLWPCFQVYYDINAAIKSRLKVNGMWNSAIGNTAAQKNYKGSGKNKIELIISMEKTILVYLLNI